MKSKTVRIYFVAWFVVAMIVLTVGMLIAAAPDSASAVGPQAPGLAPAIDPLAAPLQQTTVFTDFYDTNATAPNYNDFFGSASQLGLASCSVAQPVSLLTIYRANATTPASDVDYYFVNASPQRVLTITVAIDGPNSDLGTVVQILDANQLILNQGTASLNTPVSLSAYSLSGGRYSVRVESNNKSLTGTESKPYSLLICQSDTNVSPTPTLPPGAKLDDYEPNDSPALAELGATSFVTVGSSLSGLNFYTSTKDTGASGDVDWYFFYAKKGLTYQIATSVTLGVDTELFVYRGDVLPTNNLSLWGLLAQNDDYASRNRSSKVIITSPITGLCWIKVWNLDQTPRIGGQTYTLVVDEVGGSRRLFLPVGLR